VVTGGALPGETTMDMVARVYREEVLAGHVRYYNGPGWAKAAAGGSSSAGAPAAPSGGAAADSGSTEGDDGTVPVRANPMLSSRERWVPPGAPGAPVGARVAPPAAALSGSAGAAAAGAARASPASSSSARKKLNVRTASARAEVALMGGGSGDAPDAGKVDFKPTSSAV
jgi:hypothetical protein